MSIRKPSLKVILCGDYGVGKSSLFRRFSTNSFVQGNERASSIGFDHYERSFALGSTLSSSVILQLWDTGGMERVASVTTSYYKNADAAILIFSYESLESFNSLSMHLLDILAAANNPKIYLCGNKNDIKNEYGPSQSHIDAFIKENQIDDAQNMFRGTFSTSCKTNEGVNEMFADIASDLASKARMPPPPVDAFRVRSNDRSPHSSSDCCSGSKNLD